MISLVLECIDRLHVYSSAAHFAEAVGRQAGEAWSSILNSLYQLLGIHTHMHTHLHTEIMITTNCIIFFLLNQMLQRAVWKVIKLN